MVKVTISAQEVAQMLGVSLNTVYTAARSNQIPHTKLRGRILFNKDVIENWIKNPTQYYEEVN